LKSSRGENLFSIERLGFPLSLYSDRRTEKKDEERVLKRRKEGKEEQNRTRPSRAPETRERAQGNLSLKYIFLKLFYMVLR